MAFKSDVNFKWWHYDLPTDYGMMSGYSSLTKSSSHSFHNDESGAAVWHMILLSINLGSQDDFLWRWLGGIQKGSSLPNINSAVCLSSVYPVHIYLVPGLMHLQQMPSFLFLVPVIYYVPFPFYHLNFWLPFIPIYFTLTRVLDILVVPIYLSFTLFLRCLRRSD